MKPKRRLGFGEQIAFLRLYWPNFKASVRNKTLFATGTLQPSDVSEIYTVQVEQPGGGSPKVTVLTPQLKPRQGEDKIPHMYSQEKLCLYLPGSGEWKSDQTIALTILPWASLWLFFYEVWHATGEWLGGGVHPDIPMGMD